MSTTNSTRALTESEMLTLFDENYFGENSAESLQRTVWWFVSINFGFRGRNEARQLAWGDVQIQHNTERNCDYLEWHRERSRKRKQGAENESDQFAPRMYETKGGRCPVRYY